MHGLSNNSTFATTSAGDARWLNATGGNVIGGNSVLLSKRIHLLLEI